MKNSHRNDGDVLRSAGESDDITRTARHKHHSRSTIQIPHYPCRAGSSAKLVPTNLSEAPGSVKHSSLANSRFVREMCGGRES